MNATQKLKQANKQLFRALVSLFKGYEVRCNMGTQLRCWTLQEATAWGVACGADMVVLNRRGNVVAARQQWVKL
jgi:hypothetical protein